MTVPASQGCVRQDMVFVLKSPPEERLMTVLGFQIPNVIVDWPLRVSVGLNSCFSSLLWWIPHNISVSIFVKMNNLGNSRNL